MHSEVHHPDLGRIPEIAALFGKRSEGGLSSLLLPNGLTPARWCEPDPQMLPVPVRQRFGIMSSKEQTSDSGYSFPFRSSGCLFSSGLGRRRLCGILCRHSEFVPWQNKTGPESIGNDLKYL